MKSQPAAYFYRVGGVSSLPLPLQNLLQKMHMFNLHIIRQVVRFTGEMRSPFQESLCCLRGKEVKHEKLSFRFGSHRNSDFNSRMCQQTTANMASRCTLQHLQPAILTTNRWEFPWRMQ